MMPQKEYPDEALIRWWTMAGGECPDCGDVLEGGRCCCGYDADKELRKELRDD